MQKTFHFLKWSGKKAVACLCVALVLTLALAGTTIALVVMRTNSLVNEFTPANLSIDKTADGKGVINDGEVKAYVRAAVVFTWESTSVPGTISSVAPIEGVDYNYTCSGDWVKAVDGFWYFTKKPTIAPGESFNVIDSVTVIKEAPAGYKLSVELLLDAIQAEPSGAVTESWKSGVHSVTADGKLVIIKPNEG